MDPSYFSNNELGNTEDFKWLPEKLISVDALLNPCAVEKELSILVIQEMERACEDNEQWLDCGVVVLLCEEETWLVDAVGDVRYPHNGLCLLQEINTMTCFAYEHRTQGWMDMSLMQYIASISCKRSNTRHMVKQLTHSSNSFVFAASLTPQMIATPDLFSRYGIRGQVPGPISNYQISAVSAHIGF